MKNCRFLPSWDINLKNGAEMNCVFFIFILLFVFFVICTFFKLKFEFSMLVLCLLKKTGGWFTNFHKLLDYFERKMKKSNQILIFLIFCFKIWILRGQNSPLSIFIVKYSKLEKVGFMPNDTLFIRKTDLRKFSFI